MGTLEDSGKKRAKRRNLKKAVLHFLNNAAIAGEAIMTRRMSSQLKATNALYYEQKDWGQIARTKRNLIAAGLVYERGGYLHITRSGKEMLKRMDMALILPEKPKSWDGRWRLLIFDIPETRKMLRDKIRHTLVVAGLLRLQDSVWIYPYECEEYVTLLKAELKVGQDLLYAIVDELEGDAWVRKHFEL